MKSVDSEIDVSHVQIRVFYGIAVGISDQGAADHESGVRAHGTTGCWSVSPFGPLTTNLGVRSSNLFGRAITIKHLQKITV